MSTSALQMVNPNAVGVKSSQALFININAGKGLMEVLKSNLGPKGTLKMLVGGAGDIKLTKDGSVLLHEMQIQNPTATLIARTATAQDDITGDGTTSAVLLIGELLKQAERYLGEGLHPRVLTEGFEKAREEGVKFLEQFRVEKEMDRELRVSVSRTSLRTKLYTELADQITEIVADAVEAIRIPEKPIDLHMVEVMAMKHKEDKDSRLVRGIVMDHGSRHPDMPTDLKNCFILTCNVSLEYEKSEVSSGFFYSNAQEREKMMAAERKMTDERVMQIIELKRQVCDTPDKSFVVINQKGIDAPSLDMLAKENIIGLRRAKRRNMERLTLACGGTAINSTEDMTPDILGWAGHVYEHTMGDDKFTFVEDVKHPQSVTILLKGPNDHTIAMLKDAVRDGLRAVKNCIEDKCVIPGAGAFEVALHHHLETKFKHTVQGRAKLGVQAFADAMLIIPKTLAKNSGHDPQETFIALQEEIQDGHIVGLDIFSGDPTDPQAAGIWDNYRVKRQMLSSSCVIATQLLLVDEVMRAGRSMRQQQG